MTSCVPLPSGLREDKPASEVEAEKPAEPAKTEVPPDLRVGVDLDTGRRRAVRDVQQQQCATSWSPKSAGLDPRQGTSDVRSTSIRDIAPTSQLRKYRSFVDGVSNGGRSMPQRTPAPRESISG